MSYSISKEFAWKEVGDRVVILHLESGRYSSLNSSGSLIWKGLMEKRSEENIAAGLFDVFDVQKEEAQKDTQEMIHLFLEKRKITRD